MPGPARPPRPPRRSRCPASRSGARPARGPTRSRVAGRAVHGRAPGLHHRAPVGLLVVGGADHEDLALQPEQPAGEGQREPHWPAPVSVAACSTPASACSRTPGDGGVGLVRAGRRDALVLVVDARRGIERALEAPRAVQRRRAPQLVGLADRLRDLDLGLGETSCSISAIGKIGVRSSGPAGSIVPGLSGGSGSPGRSGSRFTQWVGMRSSVSRNFVGSVMRRS